MKTPHGTNVGLLAATVCVLAAPCFLLALSALLLAFGVRPSFLDEGAALSKVAVLLGLTGAGLWVASILRSWLQVVIAVAGFGLLLLGFGVAGWPQRPPDAGTYLEIGEWMEVPGIDVFCNGVRLGRTPLTISREELDRIAPPLEEPPRQERMENYPPQDMGYVFLRYSAVPVDPFKILNEWPPSHFPGDVRTLQELLDGIADCPYWWGFEKDGHVGMASLMNFASGFSSGLTGRRVQVTPDLTFPAREEHVALMVYGLREVGYRPSEAWLDHFLRYEDLLFLPFWHQAREDPRLRPALETVVRKEFGLPVKPDREDCRRVITELMDRAEARGGFAVPSPESMAVQLMGNAAGEVVAEEFRRNAHLRWRSHGYVSRDDWTLQLSHGKAARPLPLVHALKLLRPPEAFPALVYQYSRNDWFFGTVASYGTTSAKRLFFARTSKARRRGLPEHALDRLVAQVAAIQPPALQTEARYFLQEHAGDTSARFDIRRFILARVGRPDIDQDELASWVRNLAFSNERQWGGLLWEIPAAHEDLSKRLTAELHAGDARVADAVSRLARHPSSAFAGFLVQAYERYLGGESTHYSVALSNALVRTDSPDVRTLIKAKLQEGGEARSRMLEALDIAQGDLSKLAWTVELLASVTDPQARRAAAGLLGRVYSQDAEALLRRWAQSDNANVADMARHSLAAHEQHRQEAIDMQRKYEALISGRLAPDDLLPPAQAWVWDRGKYVPESTTTSPE